MKTIKIMAVAAAIAAVMSCSGNKTTKYGQLGVDTANDKEVKALEVTDSAIDSVSYLLGVNYGLMFKGNGFFEEMSEINMNELKKGIEDAMAAGNPANQYGVDEEWAKKFKVSPYDMNSILNGFLADRRAYKMTFNKKVGEKFLAENASKAGVQQTESGLQYILHEEGDGEKVQPTDKVLVNYKGTLIDGTEFDANDSTEFLANQVIKGWTEGLGLLAKGGKATLFIPSELAYGERGAGRDIEPNSTLVFEVEVLDIIKAEE
jgi:FKBP-type peptidyl-prolyl cis-trans isomerase